MCLTRLQTREDTREILKYRYQSVSEKSKIISTVYSVPLHDHLRNWVTRNDNKVSIYFITTHRSQV